VGLKPGNGLEETIGEADFFILFPQKCQLKLLYILHFLISPDFPIQPEKAPKGRCLIVVFAATGWREIVPGITPKWDGSFHENSHGCWEKNDASFISLYGNQHFWCIYKRNIL
jgi:hypothetical protein